MICKRGGFIIIQRHNKLRDLEAELLKMVCYDVGCTLRCIRERVLGTSKICIF